MPVNTARVEGRRKLDYKSLTELLADADRLGSGPVKALGNWSAGQIFRHLAVSYNSSIDGFTMTFPWYMRLMAKIFKNKLLAGPMPAGINLAPANAKTVRPRRLPPRRAWPSFTPPSRAWNEKRTASRTPCSVK